MPNLSTECQENTTFGAKNTNPHTAIPKPGYLTLLSMLRAWPQGGGNHPARLLVPLISCNLSSPRAPQTDIVCNGCCGLWDTFSGLSLKRGRRDHQYGTGNTRLIIKGTLVDIIWNYLQAQIDICTPISSSLQLCKSNGLLLYPRV